MPPSCCSDWTWLTNKTSSSLALLCFSRRIFETKIWMKCRKCALKERSRSDFEAIVEPSSTASRSPFMVKMRKRRTLLSNQSVYLLCLLPSSQSGMNRCVVCLLKCFVGWSCSLSSSSSSSSSFMVLVCSCPLSRFHVGVWAWCQSNTGRRSATVPMGGRC